MNRDKFKPTNEQIQMKKNEMEKELQEWIDDKTTEAMQFQLDNDHDKMLEDKADSFLGNLVDNAIPLTLIVVFFGFIYSIF